MPLFSMSGLHGANKTNGEDPGSKQGQSVIRSFLNPTVARRFPVSLAQPLWLAPSDFEGRAEGGVYDKAITSRLKPARFRFSNSCKCLSITKEPWR
jgi:hypothetical protein